MRGLHLVIGLLTVIAFLVTGQLMSHHVPPMSTLSDSARLMFRSRHIYILASGLVNLMLGLYIGRRAGWRNAVQLIGSGLLMASAALLIVAFGIEPAGGFQESLGWSAAGLYTLFGGCMLHLVSGIGKPGKPD